jgi:hypothetical protein
MWSFIKICLICIIGINRLKEKFHRKTRMLNYSLPCSCSKNLSSFWLILKQQWTIEEISIFSNSSHLEWRAGLSDTILKGTHPGTIPARFNLIWFSSFRGEDLNVIFYQNMPNLHNRYKSAERKIPQKKTEYILNYSFQGRRFKCESLRRTTDTKWWKKLTWPLVRWAKNENNQ